MGMSAHDGNGHSHEMDKDARVFLIRSFSKFHSTKTHNRVIQSDSTHSDFYVSMHVQLSFYNKVPYVTSTSRI